MSLAPGTRVGPYDIVAPIGAGGMGEVYRAHDAKLGRDVAIKILPAHFVADAERLARFEREARTLASLNHPNIAQIYGMEEAGAGQSRALVMELVEGDDLSAMIARGSPEAESVSSRPRDGVSTARRGSGMPLADALPIAKQIAQALEAAHELGIVHRDLKPANIKVRPDGTVKVLDFGLAKAMDASGVVSGSLANSPTITNPATEMGTILGTAAYMSPEQARGKPVDRRADVWAFGVVLYELLSGRRAFDGSEVSDVLASVLKDTIAFDALPADTPPAIRRLLRRCLEKNRADRLDSMATARLEIADALAPAGADDSGGHASGGDASSRPRPRRANPTPALSGVAAAFAILAAWAWFKPAPAAPGGIVRFSIELPPGPPRTDVAITAAGDALVYDAGKLFVRSVADAEPRAIPGTDGARMVFVSPDGRWAGFFAGGAIKKVAIAGGDPLRVTDADSDSPGAAWGPDNQIYFSAGWNAPLSVVSADGGTKPTVISTVDAAAGELAHWWPEPLPGGKALLFTDWMAASGINDARIAVLDLATGKHRILMPGSNAKYLSTGHLLYFHAGGFYRIAFDPVTVRVAGDPVKVLPDARPLDPSGSSVRSIAASTSGTLAYLSGALEPTRQLAWATQAGIIEPIAGQPQAWLGMQLSPDGRRIVAARSDGGTRGLWLHDLIRQTDEKIEAPGATFDPVWSPTGDFLLFTSLRKGHFDIAMLRPAEAVVRPVIEEPFDQGPMAVTHDGKRMVMYENLKDGTSVISIADLDQPARRTRLSLSATGTDDVRVSPDDRWIAASNNSSVRREVVVAPLSASGATIRVSSRGGETPLWSTTGSKLYYQRDDEVVVATYSLAGGRFAIEREETLFRLGDYDLMDLAPDGRFLLSRKLPGQDMKIRVVVNWFAEFAK
jgi:eukaryotic-like serine/threonine-protein kinase